MAVGGVAILAWNVGQVVPCFEIAFSRTQRLPRTVSETYFLRAPYYSSLSMLQR